MYDVVGARSGVFSCARCLGVSTETRSYLRARFLSLSVSRGCAVRPGSAASWFGYRVSFMAATCARDLASARANNKLQGHSPSTLTSQRCMTYQQQCTAAAHQWQHDTHGGANRLHVAECSLNRARTTATPWPGPFVKTTVTWQAGQWLGGSGTATPTHRGTGSRPTAA